MKNRATTTALRSMLHLALIGCLFFASATGAYAGNTEVAHARLVDTAARSLASYRFQAIRIGGRLPALADAAERANASAAHRHVQLWIEDARMLAAAHRNGAENFKLGFLLMCIRGSLSELERAVGSQGNSRPPADRAAHFYNGAAPVAAWPAERLDRRSRR